MLASVTCPSSYTQNFSTISVFVLIKFDLFFLGIHSSKSKVPLWPFLISSKSKVPVWPFLILSFFGGAYALLPYFVLWTPPPPPVEETEIKRWPLNFLESKLTAAVNF
jgi:RsiW-degrading membrane proteinase PrsW (M82 family)